MLLQQRESIAPVLGRGLTAVAWAPDQLVEGQILVDVQTDALLVGGRHVHVDQQRR